MIDPEEERKRLANFYAGQLDGELEKVAGQAFELTELARIALRAELKKRGLNVQPIESAPMLSPLRASLGNPPTEVEHEEPAQNQSSEFEFRRMVTIRRFRDLPEALLAKGSLDSAGIGCALVDDNIVRMDWLWSNSMGGIKLQVDGEDAAAADEILSQPIPANFDVSGIGEYEQPKCPRCGSLDISFQELQPAAYLSVALVPMPFHRRAWRCHSCDAEWEDDPFPGPAESTA